MPSRTAARSTASEAADAGSQNAPSTVARSRCAARMSACVDGEDGPLRTGSRASDRALPRRRVADPDGRLATVRGSSTGRPLTRGAAPAAWPPSMRGRRVHRPSAKYSRNPRQYAVMLPALPTGMASTSGASSQLVDDLEGGGLGPCCGRPVDQGDARVGGQLAHRGQRLVEVAGNGKHVGAVHLRLHQLAGGDRPRRDHHRGAQPEAGAVRRCRRGGVAPCSRRSGCGFPLRARAPPPPPSRGP